MAVASTYSSIVTIPKEYGSILLLGFSFYLLATPADSTS